LSYNKNKPSVRQVALGSFHFRQSRAHLISIFFIAKMEIYMIQLCKIWNYGKRMFFMKKFELLREDKLKRRLIRENIKRVHMTSAVFSVVLPIIMILHAIYELPLEIRAVYYSFLFCFELISIAFFTIASYSERKKKRYRISILTYRSYWLVMILMMSVLSYMQMYQYQNMIPYCLMTGILSLVPMFSGMEYICYMTLQSGIIVFFYTMLDMQPSHIIGITFFNGTMVAAYKYFYELQLRTIMMKGKLFSLNKSAEEDPLTKALNRRGLDKKLNTIIPYAIRNKTAVALLIVDIDNFKKYNDTFGHPEGDKCLKAVAEAIMKTAARENDLTARIGGEEFLIFVNGGEKEGPVKLAEMIRKNVEALHLQHYTREKGHYVTVSIGVASMIPKNLNCVNELYHEADSSLYTAKKSGRNIVAWKDRVYEAKAVGAE